MSVLKRVSDGPTLVVCTTCKFSPQEPVNDDGQRGGQILLEAIQTLKQADSQYNGIEIEPMSCLFACSSHCTTHLRADGKIGYILASFEPTKEAATALLEYARFYADSAEGVVPYPLWPEGVKGHFLARIPPAGMITTD